MSISISQYSHKKIARGGQGIQKQPQIAEQRNPRQPASCRTNVAVFTTTSYLFLLSRYKVITPDATTLRIELSV